MADEQKSPPKADNGGETPKPVSKAEASPAGSPPSGTPGTPAGSNPEPAKPAATAPAKPAAAAPAKPTGAAPAKPAAAPAPKAPVKPDPWTSPLLDALQKAFPGAIQEAVIFRKMPSITVAKESLLALCHFLRSEAGGAYTLLTDETAVDYPKREKRFDIVYHLYSFERNDRLRLKVLAAAAEPVPSVTEVWPAANWLEREVYDMFGVFYEGHPDLKRILLPDEWVGHPLRKDYDILRQDAAWVKSNLGIESGQ
ncbi:MAG: NADH-quinone oxidoreductase subunit C [Candidatus Korobacteraceae bacterium]